MAWLPASQLLIVLLLLASWFSLTLADAVHCDSSHYGSPSLSDCRALLHTTADAPGIGIKVNDPSNHLFADLGKFPSRIDFEGVTTIQWMKKQDLPERWSKRSCNILLITNTSTSGSPLYDTANYVDIARSANAILGRCWNGSSSVI